MGAFGTNPFMISPLPGGGLHQPQPFIPRIPQVPGGTATPMPPRMGDLSWRDIFSQGLAGALGALSIAIGRAQPTPLNA